jgi:hypothetical protein
MLTSKTKKTETEKHVKVWFYKNGSISGQQLNCQCISISISINISISIKQPCLNAKVNKGKKCQGLVC